MNARVLKSCSGRVVLALVANVLLTPQGWADGEVPTPPLGNVTLYDQERVAYPLGLGPQWGWPAKYELGSPGAPIARNRARYVSFLNIPSATRILFSSDGECGRTLATAFWVELRSIRETTVPADQTQPIRMTELLGVGKDQLIGGLRVVETYVKEQNINLDKLACVMVTTSRKPGQRIDPATSVATKPASAAENTGSVTFFNENPGYEHLTYHYRFPAPGRERQYEFTLFGSGFPYYNPKDQYPKPNKNIASLMLQDVPSATTVTFSSNATCQEGGDFSVTLRSVRNGASTSNVNLSDLFRGSEGLPLENGFILVSKQGAAGGKLLRCMRVSLSRKPGQAVPSTEIIAQPSAWQVREEKNHDFKCSQGMLLGRAHDGDENGKTDYLCSAGAGLASGEAIPSSPIKESSGTKFMCQFDQVLVGRAHRGDENADTTYYCASLTYQGKPVAVTPQATWHVVDEKKHRFVCPGGAALVGRWHSGDEEGEDNSSYRCGTLKY